MIDAKDAVFWFNHDLKIVMVKPHSWGCPEDRPTIRKAGGHWCDPIGAAYAKWDGLTNKQRIQLMLETAIDEAMQGIPLKTILTAFTEVREFRALGGQSYPMCRALTAALIGRSLEPIDMSFEELLIRYAPDTEDA
jgi:hypothetical protein